MVCAKSAAAESFAKPLHTTSMYKSVAGVLQVIAPSVVLLLAMSAEPASSANALSGFNFDESPIVGVDAYTWASKGSALVYATGDGTLWSTNGPGFAKPTPIIKIAVPKERQIEQIVWSPDGRNIAVATPRSNDLWDTIWLGDI